ncbi:MAG: hypothetical protein QN141_05475 [Armatimonadota bacterium]|nr:hypothetical protein [Armatimonadota bacterium]MDR7452387.1 hypothetical protein [Armatimonadota bacterium]MDR7466732.1 hypothetical protein [Armatimonadota bacterium]MDR7492794.1 hypothetical protein [Armatimonadota bacterium]MDR7498570.1 hypothetical protein [Armatimonadota bacterium]
MRRIPAVLVAAGLLVGVAGAAALGQYGGSGGGDYGPPAQAGNKAAGQLRTAIEHAKNSAASQAAAAAVTHLGHALNCIEGTKGKNFNGSWGHVCQGQGDGILTDIKGERNAASVMIVLEAADELAAAGVKSGNLAAVQNAARGVAALLQIVMDGLR